MIIVMREVSKTVFGWNRNLRRTYQSILVLRVKVDDISLRNRREGVADGKR